MYPNSYPNSYSIFGNNNSIGSAGAGLNNYQSTTSIINTSTMMSNDNKLSSGLGVGSVGNGGGHIMYNSIGMPMGIVGGGMGGMGMGMGGLSNNMSLYQQSQAQAASLQMEQSNAMFSQTIIQQDLVQQQMDQQLQLLQQQSQMQLDQLNSLSSGNTLSNLSNFSNAGMAASPFVNTSPVPSAPPSHVMEQQQKQLQQQKEKENIEIVRQQMKMLQQGKELTAENNNQAQAETHSVTEGKLVDLDGPADEDKVKLTEKLTSTMKQLEEVRDSVLCQICMDRQKDTVIDCGHLFCGECLSWIGGRHLCPVCRQEFKNKIRVHMN